MESSKVKSIPVRVPENLDCEELIALHKPTFNCKPDKIKYLINLILERMSWDKSVYESNNYPFIGLHTQSLKQVIYDYQYYTNFMVSVGVLHELTGYSAGNFPKSYQITEEYRTKTKDDFIRDPKFIARIYQKLEEENQNAQMLHPHLVRWLPGLKINSQLAKQWADHRLSEELSILNKHTEIQKAYCKHANCLQSIARISRGLVRCIVDTSGHRMHHVLTNMKSDLRNAVTYNGERLVSIDLSSSQVYLLSVLNNKDFYFDNQKSAQIRLTNLGNNVQEQFALVSSEVRKYFNSQLGVSVSQAKQSESKDNYFEEFHREVEERLNSPQTGKQTEQKDKYTLYTMPSSQEGRTNDLLEGGHKKRLYGLAAILEEFKVYPTGEEPKVDQILSLCSRGEQERTTDEEQKPEHCSLREQGPDHSSRREQEGENEQAEELSNEISKGDTEEESRLLSSPMCCNDSVSYMCGKSSNHTLDTLDDWKLLRESVETGQFYEYMLNRSKPITSNSKVLTRADMKTIIFTVLFSRNNGGTTSTRQHKTLFAEIFPNVYELIKLIKASKHNTLALLLQNIESEIFLNRITKRISEERPDLPICTIHDSVCTTVGNEDFVQQIMREELFKATGVKPFLKREYWSEQNLLDDLDPDSY